MGIPAPNGVGASGLPPAGDQASAVVSGQLTAVGPGDPFAFRGPMDLSIYASINTTLTTTNASSSASVASGAGIAIGAAINSANVPYGTTWATFAGTSGTLALPAVWLACRINEAAGATNEINVLNASVNLLGATVTGPGIPAIGYTVTAIIRSSTTAGQFNSRQSAILQLSGVPTPVPTFNVPVFLRFQLTNNAILTGADANAIFTGVGVNWTGTVQLERSFDGGATWIVCNSGGGGTPAQYTGLPVSIVFGEPEKNVLYRVNCIAYTSGTINYRVSQTGGANEALAIGPLANG